jgi:hypothetical protein
VACCITKLSYSYGTQLVTVALTGIPYWCCFSAMYKSQSGVWHAGAIFTMIGVVAAAVTVGFRCVVVMTLLCTPRIVLYYILSFAHSSYCCVNCVKAMPYHIISSCHNLHWKIQCHWWSSRHKQWDCVATCGYKLKHYSHMLWSR